MAKQVTIKEWVEALRSGEYHQGVGTLRDTSAGVTHCCLGVAAEVAGALTESNECESNDISSEDWIIQQSTALEAGSFYGLPYRDIMKLNGGEDIQNILIQMNDDNLEDFATIADYIEDKLPLDGVIRFTVDPEDWGKTV